jgi:hypothetical protein
MRYTHDVQYVDFNWDQVEEKGPITASAAIEAFRRFPFKEQQQKAQQMSEPTMPTISFRSLDDGAVLSVWSTEPDRYEVYFEFNGEKVTIDESDALQIEDTIGRFFSGSRDELISDLSRNQTAVVKRGIKGWLRKLFANS